MSVKERKSFFDQASTPTPPARFPNRSPVEDTTSEYQSNSTSTPRLKENLPGERKVPPTSTSDNGGTIKMMQPSDYIVVQRILQKPQLPNDIESQAQAFQHIWPYLIQRIKMWGPHVLEPQQLVGLFKPKEIKGTSPSTSFDLLAAFTDPSTSETTPDCSTSPAVLNRLDTFNLLVRKTDPIVMQDIFRILSFFPVALPLVIPFNDLSDPNDPCHYKIVTHLLRNCIIKWGRADGTVCENNLLQSPFKMIGAIRIGPSLQAGKSSILNAVLKHNYAFSSSQEAGAENGRAVTSQGTIELTWLTQETCSEDLWEVVHKNHYREHGQDREGQVLLLANLHGDALEFQEHLKFLHALCSSMIVFVMPTETQLVAKDRVVKLTQLVGRDHKISLMVDSPRDHPYPEEICISTSQLTNVKNISKVIKAFQMCMSAPKKHFNLGSLPLPSFSSIPQIQTDLSIKLIEQVVQQSNLKQIFPSKLNLNSTLFSLNNFMKTQPPAFQILDLFVDILHQPLVERRSSLIHLDSEISKLTQEETFIIRKKLMKTRKELSTALAKNDPQIESKVKSLQKEVRDIYGEIDLKSLGMEHFYRELNFIYQEILASNIQENTWSNKILNSAAKCADVLLEGQAIEILDGDIAKMSAAWLNSVLHNLCTMNRSGSHTLKVFVVSIIGLQSSGKSTLLNALFGCKFAVSAGRCTRGLFLRLLFLEKSLADEIGVEAILLIDTEGLGAPEKTNDPNLEKHDRLMATYAVSISNLTIVNVLGENLREIQEILQIVIVTVGRLKEADLTPEVVVVQHTSEKNRDKRAKAVDEFRDALLNAIEIVEKQCLEFGVDSVKTVRYMRESFNSDKFFVEFPSFKDGATVNAPPSTEYHTEVLDLYKRILDCAKKNRFDFHRWHDRLKSFWEAVSDQEFSLRFKNILEFQEHVARGDLIAGLKEKISKCLRSHEEKIKIKLNEFVSRGANENFAISDNIIFELENFLYKCRGNDWDDNASGRKCEFCQAAVENIEKFYKESKGKPFELEVRKTMNEYQDRSFATSIQSLQYYLQAIQIRQDSCSKFDDIIMKLLNEKLRSNQRHFNDQTEREQLVNQIWTKLVQTQTVLGDRDEDHRMKIYNEIHHEFKVLRYDAFELSFGMTDGYREGSGVFNDIQFQQKENALVRNIKSVFGATNKLTPAQYEELEREFGKIPSELLRKNQFEHYECNRGLAANFRNFVHQKIKLFEKQYGKEFASPAKVIEKAVTIFLSKMYEIEKKWRETHSPLGILMNKEAFYKQKIDTTLRYGFGLDADGANFAHCLLQGIEQEGLRRGEDFHSKHVLGLSWLSSSENCRLIYFSELARKVDAGQYDEAIHHFKRPSNSLQSWLHRKVDEVSTEKRLRKCQKVVESQIRNFVTKIETLSSVSEIFEFGHSYCIRIGSTIPTKTQDTLDQRNVNIFRQRVIQILNQYKFEGQECEFIPPSEDGSVLERFGCTHACPWCGAICWGQWGHELNSDATKTHATSHQPSGLHGTHGKDTLILSTTSCDRRTDEQKVWWNDIRRTWKETKQLDELKDWMFTTHAKSEFNSLMYWFFIQLNRKLAASWDYKPLSAEDLEELKRQQKHNLKDILADISQRIKT